MNEMTEWQHKYNPEKLELGMVSRDCFVDINDLEYFANIAKVVSQFETHIGERLPEDFRKYVIYCGHLFFNWSVCSIDFWEWNQEDEKDNTQYCMWCKQSIENTTCTAHESFDENNANSPFLIRFSHEGCGMFKFIIVKGENKGEIWDANPNCYEDEPYLTRSHETFLELINRIYDVPSTPSVPALE